MGGISPHLGTYTQKNLLVLSSCVRAGFPASSLPFMEVGPLKTMCVYVCVIMHASLLLTVVPSRSSLEAETCTVPHKCGWSEPPLFSASKGRKKTVH